MNPATGSRAAEAPNVGKAQSPTEVKDCSWFGMIKCTFQEWSSDNAPTLGAALAFYTLLSLGPLLLIVLSIASFVVGGTRATGELQHQMTTFLGETGAKGVQELLESAQKSGGGKMAAIIGTITLLVSATGLVGQLKTALNTIWNVQPKPGRGFLGFIRDRVLGVAMVLTVGFLLLASMVVSTLLSLIMKFAHHLLPVPDFVARFVDLGVSLGVITLLFALMFKYLPDVKIAWRNVWIGAAATAALFVIGKYLLGLYLGRSSMSSSFGAAGSIVLVVVWVYYSAQIMFLGAEFTQVYSKRRGEPVEPNDYALPADHPDIQAEKVPVQKALSAVPPATEPGIPQRPGEIISRPAQPVEILPDAARIALPRRSKGSVVGGVAAFAVLAVAKKIGGAAPNRRNNT